MKKIGLLVLIFTFFFTLAACGKDDGDQKVYDEAYQALNVVFPGGDSTKVVTSFTVPTSLRGGVVATWTSSDTTYANITTSGTITTVNVIRPAFGEGNKNVTLTATVSFNDIQGSKQFQFTILEEPDGIVEKTISEIKATTVTPNGDTYDSDLAGENIRIKNVTVVGLDTDGYYISDGITALFVFNAPGDVIKVGQKGDILGEVALYYGAYQLANSVTWSNVTTGHTVTPIEVDLADYWLAADASDATILAAKNNPALGIYMTFEAKVEYREDFIGGGNYMLTLVDAATAGTSIDENFVLSYYKTQLHNSLAAYDGLTATFTATVRELRDARDTNATIGKRPVYSLSIQSIVLPDLTDQQKADVDANLIKLTQAFTEAGTITLPTTGSSQSSTITWAFKDSADPDNQYIDLTTGAVTIPADVQVATTITATVTNGTATATKDFEIVIGEFPVSTIAEVRDDTKFADGDTIRIQGILTGRSTASAYWIQDATGALNIYVPSDLRDAFSDYAIGVELEIIGELDIYNGLYEIAYFTSLDVKVIDDTPAIPAAQSINDVDFTSVALLPYQGELVSFEGFLLKTAVAATDKSFNFTLYNPVNGKQIGGRVDAAVVGFADINAYLAAKAVNDPINVVGGILGWYNGYQLVIQNKNVLVDGTLTDDHKVALDAASISIPAAVAEAGTLVLPSTGTNGSTIAWESDNALIDATTGAVTMPESGQVTVTLTATITKGSASKEVEFEVLVGVPAGEVETILYETGFEAPDFTATTSYNNATVKYQGPTNFQWGILSGSTATTNFIEGAQSMQMRKYNSVGLDPYVETNFTLTNVTKVEFSAKNTAGNNVTVSISIDNGVTFIESQTYTLSTDAAAFTYTVAETYRTNSIVVRFTFVAAETFTDKSQVTLDNVKIYGFAS